MSETMHPMLTRKEYAALSIILAKPFSKRRLRRRIAKEFAEFRRILAKTKWD